MQDKHENSRSLRRFLRQHGYTLALLLCVAAVGVSGYAFIRTALSSRAERVLGEEASVSIPVRVAPDGAADGAQGQDAGPERETGASEDEAVPAAGTDEAPRSSLTVWPVSGETVKSYSMQALQYSKTMRDWRTHDGLDIAAAPGAPVRAAMAGTVERVYDDDFLGTTVVLVHPDGCRTVYAGLTEMPAVTVGAAVSAGQTIGAVGTTALGESAETPHLHFAASRGGVSIDPAELLP